MKALSSTLNMFREGRCLGLA